MTMTDELDAERGEFAPTPSVDARLCELPGCENYLPADSHHTRHYCDEHAGRSSQARTARKNARKAAGGTSSTGDTPPAQVVIGLGGGAASKKSTPRKAKEAELDAVKERAAQIIQLTAGLVMVASKGPHKEADAMDIANGAEPLSGAVRELAVHEAWLRALGAGGEMSARALAWVGLIVTAATVASPILVRHEVIKGATAELAERILSNATAVTGDSDSAAA